MRSSLVLLVRICPISSQLAELWDGKDMLTAKVAPALQCEG